MTLSQFFHFQTRTIISAAALLILASLLSRVLGLARNGLLSWKFGAGVETDIYFAAFRIPDFIFGILIMGGITAVFLPLFSEYAEKDEKTAWEFASNLLNILIVVLGVLALVSFFAAPFLMKLVAPGFGVEEHATAVSLTRLMLLSPILFGISSVFSGVLQYFHRFVAYSLAPILYNLGIIGGIIFLVPIFGIWGLGLGVIAGATMHLVIQIPGAIRSGFSWLPLFSFQDPALKKVLRLALPRTIAAAGYHINLIVVTALASLISAGSITIFQYANDVQHIPIGLVGASFALASFPALSRLFAQKDMEQFQHAFAATLRHILFLVVPASLLLFLLRAQITRLIYGAGTQFTWEDTILTAAVLGIFSFGIVFQALIPFLARAFFSTHDTKTPTIIGLLSVGLNIALAFFFLRVFVQPPLFFISWLDLQGVDDVRILALPSALVLSGVFQLFLLLFFFVQKTKGVFKKEIFSSFMKTAVASVVLVGVSYTILQIYGGLFDLRTYPELFGQLVVASLGGMIAYAVTAFLIKSQEAKHIWKTLVTKKLWK